MMELLAPAGSFSALCAAVQSGADAVYIGGSEFSARKGAVNFTIEEIEKAARYCHLRGVKLHIAANILIKEKEKEKFLEYIRKLNKIGVDAVIIQDMGMATLVHKMFPDLQHHASTQMTITSVEAAKKMKELGFSRVVLARELSQDAIKRISQEAGIETEVFAHGAICMSYSGQCLMSSIIGGRSGNRGMCAQPCRLPYTLGEKRGHLLSPKDLCMIKRLPELSACGVASLKIEGRLKRSEYVAAVCGVYRKYLDNSGLVLKADMDELYNAFSRSGFCDNYFDDKPSAKMMCYDNPANASENIFTDEVKKRCAENANFKRTEVFISCEMKNDLPVHISAWDSLGHFAESFGDINAELAVNKAIKEERLKEQLSKLGDTPFFVKNPEVLIDDGITLPISEINRVRRKTIDRLSDEICRREYREVSIPQIEEERHNAEKITLCAQVSTYEQAVACKNSGITEIYADTPLANKLLAEFENVRIIAKLPPVLRDDRVYEKPIGKDILISNIGQIDETKNCIGDFRLNITNSESVRFYSGLERVTLSPELNLKELSGIADGCELIAYGRIPLMVMENCPLRAQNMCQNGKMTHTLCDRRKEKFPLKCNEGCVLEILNSKPIYMADKLEIVNNLKISSIRLVFTVENSRECGKIIEEYKLAMFGEKVNTPKENTFTRGHFYRGVE